MGKILESKSDFQTGRTHALKPAQTINLHLSTIEAKIFSKIFLE